MITIICKQCGKEFFVSKSREHTAKFCNSTCYGKWLSENKDHLNFSLQENEQITIICKYCGKKFGVAKYREHTAKFCNNICYGKWLSENNTGSNNPAWEGGQIIKICEECGNSYKIDKYRSESSHFCSCDCMGKNYEKSLLGENSPNWKEKIIIICKYCGKEITTLQSRDRIFCSFECKGKWMHENLSGENNTNWRGGKDDYCQLFKEPLKIIIRNYFNNECFLCGKTKEENKQELSVHHINYQKKCGCDNTKFCLYIPLCRSCHSMTNSNRWYWFTYFLQKIFIQHPNYYQYHIPVYYVNEPIYNFDYVFEKFRTKQ